MHLFPNSDHECVTIFKYSCVISEFFNAIVYRTDKVDGIGIIENLSNNHPRTVEGDLHDVVQVLVVECKNLRSSVSRVALVCFGRLCLNLKTKMDPEIEKVKNILFLAQ